MSQAGKKTSGTLTPPKRAVQSLGLDPPFHNFTLPLITVSLPGAQQFQGGMGRELGLQGMEGGMEG